MRSGIRSGTPKTGLRGFGYQALTALTLAGLGAVMIPAAAHAAPVVSQAEGRLLIASILGVDSAPLLALDGATAVNATGTGDVVADVPLDATALGLLNLQVAPGINLFGNPGIIQLGAVGQYAGANDDGSSVAFSGTVSEASGLVGVGTVTTGSNVGTPGAGDSATISVGTAELLGGLDLVGLDVSVGAVAASAQQPVIGPPTGDYVVADLEVTVGGTLLEGTVDGLDTVIAPVLAAVNALLATDIVDPLAAGEITVTLDDLLAAAGVADINELAPGTNLLAYLPLAVVNQLTETVDALLASLQTAVTGLGVLGLPVAGLLAGIQPIVTGLLDGLAGTLAGPLGAAIDALLQLDVNTQTTNPDGSFTQNALTVGVGTAGALASVELASATVGPNAGLAGIPPYVTTVVPDRGPETGNTLVTITGGAFTGSTGVTFDGTPGTSFTVVNDNTITVRTPAHIPATVDAVILHPNGPSVATPFVYTALIAVTDIDPNFGPTAGGTPTDIFGSCFTSATGVTFGGTAGTSFTVVDDGHITVVSPPHASGAVDVVVQGTVACGGAVTVPGGFTYVTPAAPTISALTPDNGPESGGTPVIITGTGFTGSTGVTFGGTPGTALTVVSNTQITVTSPPHADGIVGVIVEKPAENSGPFDFTFTPLIDIDLITPDFGPEAGGSVVTITGDCLAGAIGVLFDGVAGTAFSEIGGVITVTTPAGAPGFADVLVLGAPACGGPLTVPGGFQYVAVGAPVITGIDPTSGPQTGGTVVTLTGTGFLGTTAVTFDGVPGTALTVVSDTEITVTTPGHAPGLADVVAQHPDGQSAPFGFLFLAATTITVVDPPTGPPTGGTTVTITGSCFLGATGVFFGTTSAASFTVVSDAEIRAVSPAGAGVVDVTVVGAPACGEAIAPDAFSYVSSSLAFTGFAVVPMLLLGGELLLGGLILAIAAYLRRRALA
jgi:hypothetical protein